MSPAARNRKAAAPRSTLVLLVRHGQTPTTGAELPGRTPGLHLSDAGRAQAEQAASRIAELGPERVAAVYASPLDRAKETAKPISAGLGLSTRVHRGLLELDVGDWTGRKLGDLAKLPEWQTVQRYPSGFTFPGGESFSTMQNRIGATVAGLVAEHPGRAVVCVSHADPIRALVAHAVGTHLDLFQRIVVSPCSITAIAYGPGGPTVLAVNSVGSSLKELAPA